MSDGHWNCWIFTNGGKESRFSIELGYSFISCSCNNDCQNKYSFEKHRYIYIQGCAFVILLQLSISAFTILFCYKWKNNQGYKIHVHVKKGLYGLKYFFVSEFYSVSFQLSMWSLIASYSWTQDELGLNE